jgi:hypothetical protein
MENWWIGVVTSQKEEVEICELRYIEFQEIYGSQPLRLSPKTPNP